MKQGYLESTLKGILATRYKNKEETEVLWLGENCDQYHDEFEEFDDEGFEKHYGFSRELCGCHKVVELVETWHYEDEVCWLCDKWCVDDGLLWESFSFKDDPESFALCYYCHRDFVKFSKRDWNKMKKFERRKFFFEDRTYAKWKTY